MSIEPFLFVALGIALGRLLAPRQRGGGLVTLYSPGDLLRLRGVR